MIAEGLKRLVRWIVWRRALIDCRQVKLPVDPISGRAFPKGRSWDKLERWTFFEDAAGAVTRLNSPAVPPSGGGSASLVYGLGLVLTEDLGLFAVDIDENCKESLEIIKELSTYTERSPSGRGFRLFLRASLPPTHWNAGGRTLEIYSHRKWVTVTGNTLEGYENVNERTRNLEALCARYNAPGRDERGRQDGEGAPNVGLLPDAVARLLLRHTAFARKWNGDFRELQYRSPSEHEMALVDSLYHHRVPLGDIARAMQQRFPHRAGKWANPKWAINVLDKASRFVSHESNGHVKLKELRILSSREMMATPAPKFIIDGFIQENSLASLFGESGRFKSFLALDWACSVASGRSWRGYSVNPGERRRVVYASAEGSPGMSRRMRAWSAQAQLPIPENLSFLTDSVHLTDPQQLERMLHVLKGLRPCLIVLDTLPWFLGRADENFAGDMHAFVEGAKALQDAFSCCVLVLTHPPKPSDGQAPRLVERGSGVLAGAAQSRFTLLSWRGPDKEHPLRRAVRLVSVKQKDSVEVSDLFFTLRPIWSAKSCVLEPYHVTHPDHEGRVLEIVRSKGPITEAGIAAAGPFYEPLGPVLDEYSRQFVITHDQSNPPRYFIPQG